MLCVFCWFCLFFAISCIFFFRFSCPILEFHSECSYAIICPPPRPPPSVAPPYFFLSFLLKPPPPRFCRRFSSFYCLFLPVLSNSSDFFFGIHPDCSHAILCPLPRSYTRWTSFFWNRRRDWEQAFSSLYYGLLSRRATLDGGKDGGHVGEGFYLQCPRYTVLWRLVREEGTGDGDKNSGRLVKTKKWRELFAREGCGRGVLMV